MQDYDRLTKRLSAPADLRRCGKRGGAHRMLDKPLCFSRTREEIKILSSVCTLVETELAIYS